MESSESIRLHTSPLRNSPSYNAMNAVPVSPSNPKTRLVHSIALAFALSDVRVCPQNQRSDQCHSRLEASQSQCCCAMPHHPSPLPLSPLACPASPRQRE
eukprot:6186370-Pleurochrysis_carterae.AAC.1